jgi:chemotaxis response regulator CheB
MNTKSAEQNFPVVCVGGSAGGLDAYIRLLEHLPPDMGVAIAIVKNCHCGDARQVRAFQDNINI